MTFLKKKLLPYSTQYIHKNIIHVTITERQS